MSFAERLKSLIGEESVSGFARRVDISEALIRKYLKGSEPSLAKANQIAMKANCSLEWLATGCGYLYRQAEVVDKIALYAAFSHLYGREPSETEAEKIIKMVTGYQYLRTHKKADGYLDIQGMATFLQLAKQDEPE
ncbi:XRE family transcriptional regulator [Photobacterium ganghwense]|uniref:DNA-binding protein n=1 Tax=Photobacterium ganghwense TaxID=320778 RepID=A0A0J1K117_9GAMM|nr:helix-turn-helix transcriptional regulator [Photobacterium ganghwense]KLV08167.1 DNA-binding protein [Photobacterium ganghwense]PSU07293.1 XRE family transcriptional regulator [Photobacterium ganghwense]QSV16025.1 helix-turn-helix transcriptional regulator [Photobacterium ganghwense]